MRNIPLEFFASSRSKPSKTCDAGCTGFTREGKPFCSEHVEKHDYVQRLLKTLEDKEEEEANVVKRGAKAIKPDSFVVKEILQELRTHGVRSAAKLAMDLSIESKKATETYLLFMAEQKMIDMHTTVRGDTTAKLRGETASVFPAEEEKPKKVMIPNKGLFKRPRKPKEKKFSESSLDLVAVT